MSNWIDYSLDVLSTSPSEMNRIAEQLNKPSQELAEWIAQRDGQPVTEGLKQLFDFKPVKNLGYIDDALNKARTFSMSSKNKYCGIIWSHLFEISAAFPTTIFLLEYFDMQAGCAGKQVIRAGEVVQEVFERDQEAQGFDWALLDIFAPFRAEYYGEEAEFGSLWQPWLKAVMAAARRLKGRSTSEKSGINITPDCSTTRLT
jgi:hypothetical protein